MTRPSVGTRIERAERGSLEEQAPLPGLAPRTTEEIVFALEGLRPRLKVLLKLYRVSPEDAEDLVQNLAIAGLTKGLTVNHLEAWLLGAAWNLCRQLCRTEMRRDFVPLDLAPEPIGPALQESLDAQIDLDRATKLLPPRHREVIRFVRFGFGKSEIATRSGYSKKSLGTLIARAAQRMSALYAPSKAGGAFRRPS